jgi:chemotaxis-related protein WspB
MLFLIFQLGSERYALDAARVVEILPLVELKKIPQAPAAVAGLFTHRGQVIPAVDLAQLLNDTPARATFATRIILIRQTDAHGREQLLGLIAENVTTTLRRERTDFHETSFRIGKNPGLGPMLLDDRGVVRLLREDRLLPDTVRDAAFAAG